MNLTQEQLAEAAGVSTTYIGLVEHGQRAVTLEKLIENPCFTMQSPDLRFYPI